MTDDLLEGLEGEAREDRIRLIELLREQGVGDDEMREAAAKGRLGLLPVDRVLQREEPCFSALDVAERSGLTVEFLRRIWRAQGLADPADEDVAYAPRDVEAAKLLGQFLQAGIDEESLVTVAHVLGQGMANIAETLRGVVGDALLQPGDTERTVGLRWAEAVEHLVPQLTPMLGYLLSVHLREQLKNDLILGAELESGRLEGGRDITVAFADLVGFTKLGERVEPAELSAAGRHLNGLAIEAARPPVRLVKMIGDAAMLVSTEPRPLMEAALAIVEAADADAEMPAPLRVGVAAGQAVSHLGDWLGAPVNLASRVTGVAKPGSVLATREVRDLVREEFAWSNAGARKLKGVSEPVRLYRARPLTEPAESGS